MTIYNDNDMKAIREKDIETIAYYRFKTKGQWLTQVMIYSGMACGIMAIIMSIATEQQEIQPVQVKVFAWAFIILLLSALIYGFSKISSIKKAVKKEYGL